jgi:hypothetical protein
MVVVKDQEVSTQFLSLMAKPGMTDWKTTQKLNGIYTAALSQFS